MPMAVKGVAINARVHTYIRVLRTTVQKEYKWKCVDSILVSKYKCVLYVERSDYSSLSVIYVSGHRLGLLGQPLQKKEVRLLVSCFVSLHKTHCVPR